MFFYSQSFNSILLEDLQFISDQIGFNKRKLKHTVVFAFLIVILAIISIIYRQYKICAAAYILWLLSLGRGFLLKNQKTKLHKRQSYLIETLGIAQNAKT